MAHRSRPGRRTMALLLRDARGRFMRLRATLAEMARTVRPRGRRRAARLAVGEQLALF